MGPRNLQFKKNPGVSEGRGVTCRLHKHINSKNFQTQSLRDLAWNDSKCKILFSFSLRKKASYEILVTELQLIGRVLQPAWGRVFNPQHCKMKTHKFCVGPSETTWPAAAAAAEQALNLTRPPLPSCAAPEKFPLGLKFLVCKVRITSELLKELTR